MDAGQCLQQLTDDIERSIQRKAGGANGCQALRQRFSSKIFHDQVQSTVFLNCVIERDDIGMSADGGVHAAFVFDPSPHFFMATQLRTHGFHSYLPRQQQILGQIHVAHPSFPYAPEETVPPGNQSAVVCNNRILDKIFGGINECFQFV